MTQESVSYHGEILRIEGDTVTLRLDDSCRTGCGGCSIRSICDGNHSTACVTVSVDVIPRQLKTGSPVIASVKPATQRLAVLLLAIAPLAIILATIIPLALNGFPKWAAVLIGASAAILWDILLSIYRRRHPGKLKWTLTPYDRI